MKIGQLAASAGVSVRTIRHYEQIGLMPESKRVGRYRNFDDDSLKRLQFILRCKELGFTLAEINEFMIIYSMPAGERCQVSLSLIKDKQAALAAEEVRIHEQQARLAGLEVEIHRILAERC